MCTALRKLRVNENFSEQLFILSIVKNNGSKHSRKTSLNVQIEMQKIRKLKKTQSWYKEGADDGLINVLIYKDTALQ